MSGLKVPVFFGSILALVIIVLQNRTPVYQLTLLGMQLQPFSLGILVAISVLVGLFLGAILQRTGRPAPRSKTPPQAVSSRPDFQTFRTTPETSVSGESDAGEFDLNDSETTDSDSFEDPYMTAGKKGWDTGVSSSWTEQAKQGEQEGRFWSRPSNSRSRKKRTGLASVTPINADRRSQPSPNLGGGDEDPSVVDAEYRIVTPGQRESTDEFDDEFFDDFFDEEKT